MKFQDFITTRVYVVDIHQRMLRQCSTSSILSSSKFNIIFCGNDEFSTVVLCELFHAKGKKRAVNPLHAHVLLSTPQIFGKAFMLSLTKIDLGEEMEASFKFVGCLFSSLHTLE
jgi:hypothetical protein